MPVTRLLFVDFNGVISMNNFWHSLSKTDHKLHKCHAKIENYLFKENKTLIFDWMMGIYTSEQIHTILEEQIGVDAKELLEIFIEETKNIDISIPILTALKELKPYYHLVMITDNMDSFDRFTLPNNPELIESFDEINNSYTMKMNKAGNNGKYFKDTVQKYNAVMSNCLLIDDSSRNCKLFESLGGLAYQARGEEQVLLAIEKVRLEVIHKWEWQY